MKSLSRFRPKFSNTTLGSPSPTITTADASCVSPAAPDGPPVPPRALLSPGASPFPVHEHAASLSFPRGCAAPVSQIRCLPGASRKRPRDAFPELRLTPSLLCLHPSPARGALPENRSSGSTLTGLSFCLPVRYCGAELGSLLSEAVQVISLAPQFKYACEVPRRTRLKFTSLCPF